MFFKTPGINIFGDTLQVDDALVLQQRRVTGKGSEGIHDFSKAVGKC